MTIKRPKITSIILKPLFTNQKVSYTIGSSEIKIPFPKYDCQPLGCRHDLTYRVDLLSKTTEAKFVNDANFNKSINGLPSFLTYDP